MTVRIRAITLGFALALAAGVATTAQAPAPFKLGTFQRPQAPQTPFVGVVVGTTVVDLRAAYAAIGTPALRNAPADMKDLIARYDQGVRAGILEVLAAVRRAGARRPAYVLDLAALKVLPPIMYPTTMMNVAVNYAEHDIEMARVRDGALNPTPTAGLAPPGTTSAPGIWERREGDKRWNPFMFLKAAGAIVADGEAVRIPPKRTLIEWECELGVVIGRPTTAAAVDRAMDYVFGYTLENDMSDRGGRGDMRFGQDWLVGKSHDTFAPLGPFITPKEFVADPGKLTVRFLLNGEQLQEGSTSQMIHTIQEQIAYGSSILSLRPGDVIATGTPPGVGSARTPPVLLKAGDRMECTYEGIGTLRNPVVGS